MSGLRGVMKEGWHPKGKDGGKESWRGDFKGINQVAGWVGMGKDSSNSGRTEHVARPLSSLKDPASFGPPPKRVDYHGPAAAADRTTPDRRGVGAPLTQEQIRRPATQQQEAAADSKPPPPPRPYRQDRTGLSTEGLPPPPKRLPDSQKQAGVAATTTKPKPNLPPRLPPRRDTSVSHSPSPPPYSESESQVQLNQGAISRLGQAGISVPGLGIGQPNSAERRDSSHGTQATPTTNNHVNELQSRFSKLSTSVSQSSQSSQSPQSPQTPQDSQSPQRPPTNGTTLAEKQAALRTAQKLHNDPSSVSVSEARSAASTVNNFRERHGDQIEAGKRKLSALNQKYGITKRINDFIEDQTSPAEPAPQPGQGVPPPPPPHPNLNRSSSNIDIEALNRRKPPPPPPPAKKPALQSAPVHSQTPPPPPLPLETKPR
ncbi:hypothetical protein VTN77DRAFT_3248 [Rasamsonia byssochlamydoides]|uniref:uncharacterized protein n=1 Tax=Rasamsonia byssochlamydoides TaxID=89139 RepID=UPI00374259F7